MTKITQITSRIFRVKSSISPTIRGASTFFGRIRGGRNRLFSSRRMKIIKKSGISEKTFSKPLAKLRKMWYIIMLGYFQ